jgi:hypothetical protein
LSVLDGAAVALLGVAMKKSTPHKLTLRAQTLRLLTSEALQHAAGGTLQPAVPVAPGFIMKDSVIVRPTR